MPLFFATSPKGLSEVLYRELESLDLRGLKHTSTGVYFDSSWHGCYRANLCSRVASRILKPILDFTAYQPEELYNQILRHDFTKHIPPEGSLRVEASVLDCKMHDQRFVALKVKDAVVDQFREKFGIRPNVDKENPDLRIHIRGVQNSFSVAIDTSGEPLSRRGYRLQAGIAPLRENLAAGLILLANWDQKSPLIDPMCGSGTFLIEGALMALNIAPGSLRKSFGFQKLNEYQPDVWNQVIDEAISAERQDIDFRLYGWDEDPKVLKIARANAERAGVDHIIEFRRSSISAWKCEVQGGMVVANPPYGTRMGDHDSLRDVYRDLGYSLKTQRAGGTAWILSGDRELTSDLKLKTSRRFQVQNGSLDCRWLKYEIRNH